MGNLIHCSLDVNSYAIFGTDFAMDIAMGNNVHAARDLTNPYMTTLHVLFKIKHVQNMHPILIRNHAMHRVEWGKMPPVRENCKLTRARQ